MATLTNQAKLTPHQAASRSTVAYKILMSLSGLFIILFLLMHAFGNLKLIGPHGAEHFDAYAHSLRTFLMPILPEKFFLTVFRIVLTLAVLIHVDAAVKLTLRNRKATNMSRGRYVQKRYLEGSFAARTMIWSGLMIAVGLVAHLAQFTWQWIRVDYPAGQVDIAPHARMILAFQNWWVWALYLLWLALICTHIYHGFYSAFVTLGARVGKASTQVIKVCAIIVAVALLLGFMLVPSLILFGVITL